MQQLGAILGPEKRTQRRCVTQFFSISNHKANKTELHPKVRKTCYIQNDYDKNIERIGKMKDHYV